VTFKLAKKIKDVHEVPKSKELVKELPLSVDFNVKLMIKSIGQRIESAFVGKKIY